MANNNDKNDKKGPFLTFSTGMNPKGERTVLHMEGFVLSSAFHSAKDDKKAMLRLGVSVGRNPWLMLGEDEAAAQASNPDVNAEKPFITVLLFGKQAEELQNIADKSKVVFCGRPTKREYKKTDDTDGVSITVMANKLFVLPTKNQPDHSVVSNTICPTVNVYTNKDGKSVEERLACLVSGKVKSVGAVKTYNDRSVINFDLELAVPALKVHALAAGTYEKGQKYGEYKVLGCAIWGPRAEHMQNVLTVGNELVVSGSTRENEYNDNTYVNMTVKELSVLAWATAANQANNQDNQTQPPEPSYELPDDDDFSSLMDVDDGELPF